MRTGHSTITKAIFFTTVLASLPAVFGAGVPLPPDAAGPPGSASARGFLVRTAQAPQTNLVANSVIRASQQLNATLLDSTRILVPNEAIPGPGPDGSYTVDMVCFEKDGTTPMDLTDDTGAVLASFNTVPFPGIPGTGGQTDNFALEAVGFLELPAGPTALGVSVSSDRTDVNNDDNYQVFVSVNPRDFFGAEIAEYQRAGAVFGSNQPTRPGSRCPAGPLTLTVFRTPPATNTSV